MTANHTLERTVSHRGRFVLAMDRVLVEAQGRSWLAAQLGRQRSLGAAPIIDA